MTRATRRQRGGRACVNVALIHHGKGCQKAIQHGLNVRTTSTLGWTNPSRIDTRTHSAWRCVSGAVPCFAPPPRTDEVNQMVRRYASGVVDPAPLSWYAAICAVYDELEGDDKEWDEEVESVGLCGRIQHDGEEVDEGAEDLVGDCEAGVA